MITVITSVTKDYWQFAKVLYKSLKKNWPEAKMCCETINFEGNMGSDVEMDCFEYRESSKEDLTLYAFIRHAFLLEKLRPLKRGILIYMNADIIIRKSLNKLIDEFENYDIAARRKPSMENYWNGLLMVNDNLKGLEFAQRYAEICRTCNKCTIDQKALNEIAPSMKMLNIDEEYLDFKCDKESYVWALKGTKKNRPFQNEAKKYLKDIKWKKRLDFKSGEDLIQK